MAFRTLFRSLLLALGLVALSGCGINSVPTAEEEAKARWADVQSAYQRRADLIPNLVQVVGAAASSEQQILTQVVQARASASQVQLTTDDLNDPAKMQQFQQAQQNLGGALSRLLVSVERYPELRSQENFGRFMTQLEGTENRIAVSVKDYNEAVRQYNTTIRTFPDTIGANIIHGAEEMVPYKAVTEGAEVAPELNMRSDSEAAN